jgi:hypothetical protein
MVKKDPEIGQTYNELTIIRYDKTVKNHKYYICSCTCGNEKSIAIDNIKGGRIKSCGHIKSEREETYGEDGARKNLFNKYKRQAKYRKLEFTLDYLMFCDITKSVCYYCGQLPESYYFYKDKKPYLYNGIDRIDNSLGYIQENSVACCSCCNHMKGTQNKDDFLKKIEDIYKTWCM